MDDNAVHTQPAETEVVVADGEEIVSSGAVAFPPKPVEKVFYDKEGVFVHVASADGSTEVQVPGRLRLTQVNDEASVEWQPASAVEYRTDEDLGWAVINPSHGEQAAGEIPVPAGSPYAEYAFKFSVADLLSVERARADLGWQLLKFALRGSQQHVPTLHFNGANIKDFWQCLTRFVVLSKSTLNSAVYDVTDGNDSILSFDPEAASTFSNLFTEESLYAGFSKVTRFVRHLGTEVGLGTVVSSASTTTPQRPGHLRTTGSVSSGSGSPTTPRGDEFELLGYAQPSMLPMWLGDAAREPPIGFDEWQEFLDGDGRVARVPAFRRRLFKGGLEPGLRHYVWKFLLNYYDFDSTATGRENMDQRRQCDYCTMQEQWQTLLPAQMKRFGVLRDRRHLINKDVLRTDRTHPRFEDNDSIYLTRLENILTTYCFYNFDLGYVQGMSDLCAPIIDVMEDEVESFWCFAGFLDAVGDNFAEDQEPMRKQLATLQAMVKVADPQLSEYLAAQDSDNLYFCFRWLLVLFKRELDFDDTMRLWEVLWSNYLTPHFHLFCALSLLLLVKDTVISHKLGFNEIIKHINELSGKIDLGRMLSDAEVLCRRFMAVQSALPPDVQRVVPLSSSPVDGSCDITASLDQQSVMCTADGSAVLSSPSSVTAKC